MNITLVYRGRYLVRQALELETMAALIRAAGHSVSLVYDSDLFGVTDNVLQFPALASRLSSPERIARKIFAHKPDAVAFLVLPATFDPLSETARLVRAKSPVPIVFMGLFPSLAAEAAIKCEAVDLVIEGEAEPALPPLLDVIASGGFDDPGRLESVPNLVLRRGSGLFRTGKAKPVDLDSLPLPDKSLFSPFVNQKTSYAAMVSRGCPFSCSFCEETCMKALYGPGYYRRKSVESVMDELVAGKRESGFKEVIFKDSYLTGDEAWLSSLMGRFKAEIGVPFKCFATIVGFDEKTARLLKNGGCYCVEFGLQTWNEGIRKRVLNRRETNAEARRVFEICAQVGLPYDIDHMFGLPGETMADHRKGFDEYRRLKGLNRVKVHHLVYLPKAPIAAYAPESCSCLGAGQGGPSDFYDSSSLPENDRALVKGWAALYKLLPVLPVKLTGPLPLRPLTAGKIPKPLMAALMGLAAIKGGDLRFLVYLKNYPALVFRVLGERLMNA